MKLLWQTLVIIVSFVLVFVWEKTTLTQFTVPAIGFLIFLYIITSAKSKWKLSLNSYIGIFVLNTTVLLLIFETGLFNSPLYFILFFILFGIAFVFDARMVFLFLLGVVILFLPLGLKENAMENLLKLGALGLISPLAYFFGNLYQRQDKKDEETEKMKERAKNAADTISEDVDEVIKDEKTNLKGKDVEKLNEILEETEDLRQESKD
jgi:hypothetical protein